MNIIILRIFATAVGRALSFLQSYTLPSRTATCMLRYASLLEMVHVHECEDSDLECFRWSIESIRFRVSLILYIYLYVAKEQWEATLLPYSPWTLELTVLKWVMNTISFEFSLLSLGMPPILESWIRPCSKCSLVQWLRVDPSVTNATVYTDG